MSQQLNPDELENKRDEEILVMFPAAKNYQKESPSTFDDPLQDLLDEFSHLEDIEVEDDESTTLDSTRSLLLKSVSESQIEVLEEVIDRMSYMLDEIEFYTKNR